MNSNGKPTIIRGKTVVLKSRAKEGKMIESIDTDMIFHNKYLHITDINEMGRYALDNLDGWNNFAERMKVEQWKFLIVGHNFGSGSSRQQAVDCFKALGIRAIIGQSFGAIYKRNAINSGMPLIELDDFEPTQIKTGDILHLNLEDDTLVNNSKKEEIPIKELSQVQLDIYQAGNLFAYGAKL